MNSSRDQRNCTPLERVWLGETRRGKTKPTDSGSRGGDRSADRSRARLREVQYSQTHCKVRKGVRSIATSNNASGRGTRDLSGARAKDIVFTPRSKCIHTLFPPQANCISRLLTLQYHGR